MSLLYYEIVITTELFKTCAEVKLIPYILLNTNEFLLKAWYLVKTKTD